MTDLYSKQQRSDCIAKAFWSAKDFKGKTLKMQHKSKDRIRLRENYFFLLSKIVKSEKKRE